MSNRTVNIIAFDVSYPPNYGGVIDIFYKIKALKESGVDVILHAFTYGRKPSGELEVLCKKVYYYNRDTSLLSHFSLLPYIVKSRASKELLKNLQLNNYPILFEGLHTTYFLNHPKLGARKKIVRTHNIEHDYYLSLFQTEKNIFKKVFFYLEYLKLKKFEQTLRNSSAIAAISGKDYQYFSKISYSEKINPFHQFERFSVSQNQKDFFLYHGNLSVPENIDAVIFLINEVFSKIDKKLIVAGANPTIKIVNLVAKFSNTSLVKNPSNEQMNELKKDALAHILYSKTNSGLKLKLIDALFTANNIIVNNEIVQGELLKNACVIANTPSEIIKAVDQVFSSDLPIIPLENRKKILEEYSNKMNVEKLIKIIFN